jgi:hypothetical protein
MVGGYIDMLVSHTGTLHFGVTSNLYQVHTAGRSCSRASVVEKAQAAWVR